MEKKGVRSLHLGLLFLSLTGFAAGMRLFLFKFMAVDMLTYAVGIAPECFPAAWCLAAGLPALLFLKPECRGSLKRASLAMLPFLLFFLLPQTNYFFFPCFLIVLGWGVFRLVRAFGGSGLRRHSLLTAEYGIEIWLVLLAVLYLLMTGWGWYLQDKASRSLYLCYSDWGTYVESYLKLASGNATWKEWLSTGAHWNPLVNVVMALFVKIFRTPRPLFLFNSLLIYSAVPLVWILCRRKGMLPFHAFCFAAAAALNPVYAHLSLCLFYGFHPIYFAIPCLLLFFIFRESKNRTGMAVCLIASLLLKETMMIFWFGYGIWLLFRRKWLAGGLLSGGCLLGFYLLSSVVLPSLVDAEQYPLIFLYSSLGNTPLDVIKSPFVKPEAFWGICFQWQNFAYLLTLLLPCFFCVWLFPGMMVAVLPLLAGICLRGSPEIKSIMLQYGTETATVLLVLAVLNFQRIRQGETSRWTRFLLFGFPRGCPRRILLFALAAATLTLSVFAHYTFAQTVWGKCGFHHVERLADQTEVIEAVRKMVPPGVRVMASERLRNHLMYQNPTDKFSQPYKTGDYLVFSLYDRGMDSAERIEALRRKIASDPKVVPVGSARTIVVFEVTDGSRSGRAPRPEIISQAEFEKIGVPFPGPDPHFAIRYLYANGRHVFLVRVQRTPDYDVDAVYEMKGPWGAVQGFQPFCWGLYPAYSCPEGTLYIIQHEAPQAADVNFCLSKRKASGSPR